MKRPIHLFQLAFTLALSTPAWAAEPAARPSWWKLISLDPAARSKAQIHLSDLSKDPWEKNHLSAAEQGKVQALSVKLNQWWKPAVT